LAFINQKITNKKFNNKIYGKPNPANESHQMLCGLTNALSIEMHNKMAGGKFSSKKIRSNQLRFFIAAS
jgi:hypothetical protein